MDEIKPAHVHNARSRVIQKGTALTFYIRTCRCGAVKVSVMDHNACKYVPGKWVK